MTSSKRSEHALTSLVAAVMLSGLCSAKFVEVAAQEAPLPHSSASSVPAELATLPAEIRSHIDVAHTCGSPVKVMDGFSSYLANREIRVIALHFENIRCADLAAICRTSGCLHQIYASKHNQPYELIMSGGTEASRW